MAKRNRVLALFLFCAAAQWQIGYATAEEAVDQSHAAVTIYQSAKKQLVQTPLPGAVRWTVEGIPGGNEQVGTVSSSGVYTAPGDATGTFSAEAKDAVTTKTIAAASISVVEDPELVARHDQWMEGAREAAATYGCKGDVIQQLPSESVADVIDLFRLNGNDGSCIALKPISKNKGLLRYSMSWGGTVDGKNIFYLSDIGARRIWNGAPAAEQ